MKKTVEQIKEKIAEMRAERYQKQTEAQNSINTLVLANERLTLQELLVWIEEGE